MEALAYYDGKIGTPEELTVPFNDRVHFFGDGVYDATVGANGKVYQADGSLVPRGAPGAMIEDEDTAIARVLQMAAQGTVQADDGSTVTLQADSVCVHGDGPKALAFVQKISAALLAAGTAVAAF